MGEIIKYLIHFHILQGEAIQLAKFVKKGHVVLAIQVHLTTLVVADSKMLQVRKDVGQWFKETVGVAGQIDCPQRKIVRKAIPTARTSTEVDQE